MKEREQLGQLIRRYREEKGFSREQLAEKCNVTDKCISNIELGKSDPKLSTVIRICAVLGINIAVLFELICSEENADDDTTV